MLWSILLTDLIRLGYDDVMDLAIEQAAMQERMKSGAYPVLPAPIIHPDAVPRFWRNVEVTDTCWLWAGTLNSGGYGKFGPIYSAHRVAYFLMRGIMPHGMHLHHRCHVRRCVNPAHLECLTASEHKRLHPQAKITNPTTYQIGERLTCNRCDANWACRVPQPVACPYCQNRAWWKGKR